MLQTPADQHHGLAISADSAHMALSHKNNTLSVYALPEGKLVKAFGSRGTGKAQFDAPAKLCFSSSGNILVAEYANKRVQEVTLSGDHVRFIGVGVIDSGVWGITANAELIVVGKYDGTSPNRIVMLDAVTGAFVRAFGDCGNAPGQVMKYCWGIRFTADSKSVVIAAGNGSKGRLSVFTVMGEFVRCVGDGVLKSAADVHVAAVGEYLVCDSSGERICVYPADGSTVLRTFGEFGYPDGKFRSPTALAMCGSQLYVLDQLGKRVQVFE